jgi:serine/threonine-protein kinase
VLDNLGQGGLARFYKARQVGLDRLVDLKVGHPWHLDREGVGRFRAGVVAQARLQHPNIEQVIAWGEVEVTWYYSTELCLGGTLAERLARGAMPPREAAGLVATLADAVEAIHRSGVIHRDLKPFNVLFTEGGVPKVTGFECSLRLGETKEEGLIGTPTYMAPEQAAGRTWDIGPHTDVWALGAILYACLTGRPPFQGAGLPETLAPVQGKEPVPPRALRPDTPPDLEAICLKCLGKEPFQRYAGAAGLGDDLHRFLRGEEVTARPAGWWERLWRRVSREPWKTAALALATAVLAWLVISGRW